MKICGIISEFNPFTNGHKYIIEQVKQKYGLDCLCLMSGNFMQRGEMAILDKYTRSTSAINSGADIVIEMPLVFSLSSAEYFARGSIKILKDLNVSHIAFGVKISDTSILEKFAKIKSEEPDQIKTLIKGYIKAGMDYNKSFKLAYKSYFPELIKEIDEIFNDPNNILAIEYLSAINSLHAKIQPIFIDRQDGGYNHHLPTKVNKMNFLSATAIRNLYLSDKINKIKKYVPLYTFKCLKTSDNKNHNIIENKFDTLIINKIREMSYKDLENITDSNTSLSHMLLDSCKMYATTKEVVEALNTKNFKESRIRRLLLLSYFNITKKQFNQLLTVNLPVNVLAVAKSRKKLLSQVLKESKRKLVVSSKDKENLDESQSLIINMSQKTSNLYNICNNKQYQEDKTIFI